LRILLDVPGHCTRWIIREILDQFVHDVFSGFFDFGPFVDEGRPSAFEVGEEGVEGTGRGGYVPESLAVGGEGVVL